MIIGLTGKAFAGKDTIAAHLVKHHCFSTISFAEPLREGLKAMLGLTDLDFEPERKEQVIDWIGRSPRELLQSLGTEWGRDTVAADLWVRCAERKIRYLQRAGCSDIVVTDLRFAEESALVRRLGGHVWRVVRPGAATTAHSGHISERFVEAMDVDEAIDNSGTPEQLFELVDSAMASLYGIAGDVE